MRILHIASHKGNIGDILNHIGFYEAYLSKYDKNVIEKIEMRDFYYSAKKRRVFDKDFADYVNSFDLCIIGGGGFFDVRWEKSVSGTTLDISDEFIEGVNIPVIINAMGYHELAEEGHISYKLFKSFLDKIETRDNWLITVRNDGSLERLKQRYGENNEQITKVADNAFFAKIPKMSKSSDNITIGMCITNDLFSDNYNNGYKAEEYNRSVAVLVEKYLAKGNRVILFNNTPADVILSGKLLSMISEDSIRRNLIVAPYNTCSEEAILTWAEYYNKCDCIVGMRFHSVILAINLHIPVVALAGHRQIEALMEDLAMEECCVRVDGPECVDRLERKIERALLNRDYYAKQYDRVYGYLEELRTNYAAKLSGVITNYYAGRGGEHNE